MIFLHLKNDDRKRIKNTVYYSCFICYIVIIWININKFLAFLLTLVIGNVLTRVIYELLLVKLVICKIQQR